MKIYTKRGDKGDTSLIGGTRVAKNHARIEAYGTVDELNSVVGIIRDTAAFKGANDLLVAIQNNLFTLGSLLASTPDSKMTLPALQEQDIMDLEAAIDSMDAELEPLKNFILPGGDLAASQCHVARCVCRRAERRTIDLAETTELDEIIVKYLNRLSDYFFALARYYTQQHGGVETLWQTRG